MQLVILDDALFLSAVVAIYLALLLRRSLAGCERWQGYVLLGAVVVAGSLRLAISREALLTAWPYTRVVPLADAISQGAIFDLLSRHVFGPVYLTDLMFRTNLILASLTPLPLFLHAKFLLKDSRTAIAAAVLLAVLPVHITFSSSDVYFIQSLFLSSLTFATLYSALTDPAPAWRAAGFAMLGPLLWSVFLVRPLNIVFFPLFLATIFITSGPSVPTRRRVLAAVIVTAAAALDLVLNLMVGYGEQVQEGLGLRTLVQALRMLVDVERNTIVNPAITPPGFLLLMVIGLATLWRTGKRAVAIYLFGWLAAFFVTHAYIFPFRATMMARYHLHLVMPTVLMAGAALPAVLRLPRILQIAGLLYVAAVPFAHLGFERGVGFSIQSEFEFLTGLRSTIPRDCIVIEYTGPADCTRAPRAQRVGAYAGQGGARWRSRSLVGPNRRPDSQRAQPHEAIDIGGVAAAIEGAPCAMFYEGNLCRSYGTGWSDLAPTCREMHERFRLEPFAEGTYREHVYDPADARDSCSPPAQGSYDPPADLARLRMYRIVGTATSGAEGS
jgi:hypothetical protein